MPFEYEDDFDFGKPDEGAQGNAQGDDQGKNEPSLDEVLKRMDELDQRDKERAQYIQQLEQKNQRLADWQEHAKQVFTGSAPNDPNAVKQKIHEQFVNDPVGLFNALREQERQERQQEQMQMQQIQQVQHAFQSKYSDLQPHSDLVEARMWAEYQKAAQQGQPISLNEALDRGVNSFKESVKQLYNQANQQQQTQQMSRAAISLDIGGHSNSNNPQNGPTLAGKTPDQVFNMSDGEWEKFRDQLLRGKQ